MTETKLIDTHCHLDIPLYSNSLDQLIPRCKELGVKQFIIPGFISSGWERIFKLSSIYKEIHAAPGLHPCYLPNHSTQDLVRLDTFCKSMNPVAIGEIGMDFYHGKEREDEQRDLFISQLNIADNHGLPILLHVRKAHDQVLSILRKRRLTRGGIVHAFNGSSQQGRQYAELGFKLGFGGTLTYKRAKKIRKVAQELPLETIVLETDAPDIPLSNRRDRPNSPEFLPEILKELSCIRGEDSLKIADTTTKNAEAVFF